MKNKKYLGRWVARAMEFGCGPATLLLVFMAYSAFGAASEETPALPYTPKDLEAEEPIRAIILQTKAAREGINSYSMKIAWNHRRFPETPLDAPLPKGKVISYGEGVWMEQGAKGHVHLTKRWEPRNTRSDDRRFGPPNPLEGKEYASWTVYDGANYVKYNSKWPGRIRMTPQKVIDAKLTLIDGYLFPFPLKWGFGFGSGYLDREYDKSLAHDVVRWERDDFETEDGLKIRLTRSTYSKRQGYDLRTEFVVDPLRDFLLVSTAAWNPPGTKTSQLNMTLQQEANGHWYPSQATNRRLDGFHEYTFAEVRINDPIEDDLFTMYAFDLDFANARLSVKKLNGSESTMLFRDDAWIPESLVPTHLRPVLPGDNYSFEMKDYRSKTGR